MNLPEKINKLISHLELSEICSEEELKYLIRNIQLNVSDIVDYANFRHPLTESYGRNILYESGKLEIVVMTWNEGDFTSIHDHGAAKWAVVCSYGNIQNTLFDIKNNKILLSVNQQLSANEITILDNKAIHQMGNRGYRPAISLHFYYTPEPVKGVTANARNFDLYENKTYIANGGAFLVLDPKNIVNETACPEFDKELYYKQLEIRKDFTDKCCPLRTRKVYKSTQNNIFYG